MVACTDHGKVRMNLDLVKEMSRYYLGRIQRLEETLRRHYGDRKEASCTINLSLEFERYGDFLLESGLSFMALKNHINAASVCTSGSPDFDSLKIPFFLRSDNQYIVKSTDFSG